ncbi:MAG: hypothetical protein J6D34_06700 [Atopobiaceae bacterium]|nr:hypothetical protein [Atopobiaceae bacterium]
MTYNPSQSDNPYMGMDGTDADDAMEALWGDGSSGETGAFGDSLEMSSEYFEKEATSAAVTDDRTRRIQNVPPTVRRPTEAPRRGVAPAAPARTSQQTLLQRPTPTPVASPAPSPRQQSYEPEPSPVVSAIRRAATSSLALLGSIALWLAGFAMRLAAIGLSLLVLGSAFLTGSLRSRLLGILNLTPLLIPNALFGQFVYETPFGGVFRGDFAIASIILFCADYFCMRFSTSLRNRRERGA